MNRFNLELLKRVFARGRVYLSNASPGGKFSLRACIVNHRTKDKDVDAVVAGGVGGGKRDRLKSLARRQSLTLLLFQADRLLQRKALRRTSNHEPVVSRN
jgi:hypothetical protein